MFSHGLSSIGIRFYVWSVINRFRYFFVWSVIAFVNYIDMGSSTNCQIAVPSQLSVTVRGSVGTPSEPTPFSAILFRKYLSLASSKDNCCASIKACISSRAFSSKDLGSCALMLASMSKLSLVNPFSKSA